MSDSTPATDNPTHTRLRCHQSILLEFSRIAVQAKDMQRLFEIAGEQSARAIGVRHSKVLRYHKERAELVMLAGKGWDLSDTGEKAVLAIDMASPPGRSFQTKTPILIGDLSTDPDYRYHPLLRKHGIRSVLNVPIAVDGVVWGVLEVDSTECDVFDDDDSAFLQTMAFVLGLAIRQREVERERNKAREDVGARLVQADTLLQEQNHRVRNYFQMILSLISLRSQKALSEMQRAEYKEVMDRIAAISLAHDLLTVESGQTTVAVAAYLGALCDNLEHSLEEGPKFARELAEIALPSDQIIPLGLILNELLTNCIKYAGINRPERLIAIRLIVNPATQEATLTVQDNGPGMGEKREGSKGLRFVNLMTQQLSGRFDIDSTPKGTKVSVTFPLFD